MFVNDVLVRSENKTGKASHVTPPHLHDRRSLPHRSASFVRTPSHLERVDQYPQPPISTLTPQTNSLSNRSWPRRLKARRQLDQHAATPPRLHFSSTLPPSF
eukprot:766408-Hanusia_phi.AAC.1